MIALTRWLTEVRRSWETFWFGVQQPHTLGLIRILAGLMLFYTHLIWAYDSTSFFGANGWLPPDGVRWPGGAWSPLFHVTNPSLLMVIHIAGLVIIAMSAAGYKSQITTKLAWLVALAYVHRMHGALFGLDQVNVMLAMYLAIGPSGDAWSVDHWLRVRAGEPQRGPSQGANLAIRLIQVHLCVIYLFGGLGKAQGDLWWNGGAVWVAGANYEYQSLEMTWLAHYPLFVATLSHLTTFWETFYCALVWPRATRPLMLGMAVAVHGGIAMFLGMITFGLAMIIANLAFVPPHWLGGEQE